MYTGVGFGTVLTGVGCGVAWTGAGVGAGVCGTWVGVGVLLAEFWGGSLDIGVCVGGLETERVELEGDTTETASKELGFDPNLFWKIA